jgi:hypothetical protein
MKYYICYFCIVGISFGLNACSTISDESTKTPPETIIPNQEIRVEQTPLTPDEYQRAMNQCLIFNKTVYECQSQVSSSKFTIIQPSR